MAAKKTQTKPEEVRVPVMIPKPKDTTGATETTVGVNGKLYQIQYDKIVYVPEEVAEVINGSNALNEKLAELEEAQLLKRMNTPIGDF